MKAVGRVAGNMVDEVRRQFREIPGIMDGTKARIMWLSTRGAQREMPFPSLLAIGSPDCNGIVLCVPGVDSL